MAKLGSAEKPLRVGAFQLGYHPSVTVSGRCALDEPLGRLDADTSLTPFAKGNVAVTKCLHAIRSEYLKWSEDRIQQLLSWLMSRPDPPHIVVLPECSVPFEQLELFFNCSKSTGTVFFAGTHSLLHGSAAQTTYKKQLNVGAQALSELIKRNTRSVLPVIDNGKTTLFPKLSPSPFEQDECEDDPKAIIPREVLSLSIGVSVTPMICSDALRLSNWQKYPDLAVIVAMDQNPSRFLKHIQTLTELQIPVAFANSALFGGSGIFAAVDQRAQHWWWSPPNSGQLPLGEAYFEVSLNLSARAVQVGTAIPATPAKLHRVNQIITTGSQIERVEITAGELLNSEDENGLKAALDGMDGKDPAQQIFLRRWQQLHAILHTQSPLSDWRMRIGEPIFLQQVTELTTLQTRFCSTAVDLLSGILAEADSLSIPADSLGRMTSLMARFKKFINPKAASPATAPISFLPIGRDIPLTEIRQFVSSTHQHAFVLTGLEAVGKSSVIGSALQQSSARCVRITCNEGTTADFIYEFLIKASGGIPAGSAPRATFPSENIGEAISRLDVLWIEDVYHLTEYGNWRDETIRDLITTILDQTIKLRRKCVLESRRAVPSTTNVGIQVIRRRLYGLDPNDAVAHFEGQLRRAGVPVDTVDHHTRSRIASAVDGHPGLLILCADVCVTIPAVEVANDLEAKRGSIANAVERILAKIPLSQDARLALDVLSECREPIPYSILESIIQPDSVVTAVQELAAGCLIDQSRGDCIEVAGIVKALHSLDRRATDEQRVVFHQAASKHFAMKKTDDDPIVRFKASIESNYHAILAGEPASAHMDSLPDAVVAVARRAVNDEEWIRVIRVLRPLENEDLNAELLSMLAEAYAWSNDFESAFRVADRALAKSRMHIDVFGTICQAAFPQRRLDDAEKALRRLEDAEPGTYQVHKLRGRLAETYGQNDIALEHFRKATELTDSDAWPFFYYSRALIERGLTTESLDVIARGLDLIHSKGSLFGSRAIQNALLSQQLMALVLSGEEGQAKQVLSVLESARNVRPEVIVCAAYVRASLGLAANDPQALSVFERALSKLDAGQARKMHTRAQIHMFRGRLHETMEDLGKAETEYTKACQIDQHNVYMKVCLLKVLMRIARNARTTENAVASKSAAIRAAEVSKDVLRYDAHQKDALHAQEDLYREFGIQ